MLTRMICVKCGSVFDGLWVPFPVCDDCEKDAKNPLRRWMEERSILRSFLHKKAA